jgi:hypothetical protein
MTLIVTLQHTLFWTFKTSSVTPIHLMCPPFCFPTSSLTSAILI